LETKTLNKNLIMNAITNSFEQSLAHQSVLEQIAQENEKAQGKILSIANYWKSIPESMRSYWRCIARNTSVIVCTHRPDARIYSGNTPIRRCSTGGKWGKKAGVYRLNLPALLKDGYIFVK
jgi:hypothetical protein